MSNIPQLKETLKQKPLTRCSALHDVSFMICIEEDGSGHHVEDIACFHGAKVGDGNHREQT